MKGLENSYLGVFGVAENEDEVEKSNFLFPRWLPKIVKKNDICIWKVLLRDFWGRWEQIWHKKIEIFFSKADSRWRTKSSTSKRHDTPF